MKKLLLMVLMVSVCSNASAQYRTASRAVDKNKTTPITVAGQAYEYSSSFKTSDVMESDSMAVMYKVSGTAPSVSIFFEESFSTPTSEGTTDTAYLITKVLDTTVANTAYEMATIDTVNMPYGRFHIRGNSGNGNNTAVTIIYAK